VRELERRILVIDGAMGTLLQAHGLSEDDYRGERLRGWGKDVKGNHELLNLSRPDLVEAAHRQYLAAGADMHGAAVIANYAAGVVVGKRGTATVTRAELARALRDGKL
jgi:methionine synthase I (cobalamin-dependent)